MNFGKFVTLKRVQGRLRPGDKSRVPGRGEGGIAAFKRIGRLAAHARFGGGEGNGSAGGEGDNEGDSPGVRPFARAVRAAETGQVEHALPPSGEG